MGCINQGVIGIFYPGKLGVPRSGTGVGDAAECCFHLLIGPLRFSIGLGVESGGEAGCGPKSPAECTPHLGSELGTSV